MMIGLDTSILIHLHNSGSRFHKAASVLIGKLLNHDELVVSEISLRELYAVITDGRKITNPLSPSIAAELIFSYCQSERIRICPVSDSVWDMALSEAERLNLTRYRIDDLLIAASLKNAGVESIYTNNLKDFRLFSFVSASNPFVSEKKKPDKSVFIPYGQQSISENDIAKVCEVLRSEWLTQGPTVPAFENAVAEKCNAQYAVAVNSATSALHIACLVLGVGPGDTVWTSPNTFVASANCARYCGASVDFVDIDPDTWCLSVEKLRLKLENYKSVGKRLPKVVIPVHLSGQSCEMQAIYELGQKYGFKIIEDASHAIGGKYQDEPVGSCKYSDITVFSFHPVKIITSGEGGMALTNDPKTHDHMERLRSHGITRERKHMTGNSDGPWYYEQLELGYNYRMTDIQAALGMSQLNCIDEFVEQRNELAQKYEEAFAEVTVQRQVVPENVYSARHLYVILVSKHQHLSLFEKFRREEIRVNLHYMPVHLQPYYRKLGFQVGDFPEAEKYGKEAISLPLYTNLTDQKQNKVITILKDWFE